MAYKAANHNDNIYDNIFSLTFAAPQSPPAHSQQSTDLCSAQVCITATVYAKDPNTIEFGLHSKIAVGWIGLGMGGDPGSMARNDLAVCWPAGSGSGAVISQRSAASNGRPSPVTTTEVPFKIQVAKSGFPVVSSGPKVFSCTYSRPLNLTSSPLDIGTTSSIPVIYAIGLDTVSGPDNAQTASFQRHVYTGMGALTVVRKEGSSLDGFTPGPPQPTGPNNGSDSENGNGTGNEAEDIQAKMKTIDNLKKAHGIIMTIVFLFILPFGAGIPRFFGDNQSVFRWHRPLQATGFTLALVAFILIIVAEAQSGAKSHFSASDHATLGLVIILAMLLQVGVGIYIFHTFDPTTHDPNNPTVPTWVHRGWGYCVLGMGFAQIHMGMKLYGAWPTGKEAVWYVYGVWVGVICAVFVLGSLLKRWRSKNRRGGGNGGSGRGGAGGADKYHEDQFELHNNGRQDPNQSFGYSNKQSRQTSDGSSVGDLRQYQI
ncbi:hypothetical protein BG004_006417 [Podila humilis]|nr:hypothetical protein BG004_006417 [Podila humilis]